MKRQRKEPCFWIFPYTLHLTRYTKEIFCTDGIDERGFILPLSVLLVVVLTISGTSFMQHDYLERRMGMNEVDNQGAFYLANAGLERARVNLRLDLSADHTWDLKNDFKSDTAKDEKLCQVGRTCYFFLSETPLSDSELPFDGSEKTSAPGAYELRVFDNEAAVNDADGVLVARARGVVRREEKLLEAKLVTPALGLITCESDADTACPKLVGTGADPNITERLDGRAPVFRAELPSLPPLAKPPASCHPENYYCDPAHFPGLTPQSYTGTISSDSYYFHPGNVEVKNDASNVVIVSLGDIEVKSNITLQDAILVSAGEIRLRDNAKVDAPPGPGTLQYPVIITAGALRANKGVQVTGTIYSTTAVGSSSNPLESVQVHGTLITPKVVLKKGSGTKVTDDKNFLFYRLLAGFTYPDELTGVAVAPGSWRELK